MTTTSERQFESLRELRKYRNISQKDMAKQLNITQPYLSNVERGNRNVSLSLLERILPILNATFIIIAK